MLLFSRKESPSQQVLVIVFGPQVLALVLGPQVLALVLGPQVLALVLGPQSPQKLSRTSHSANSSLCGP